MSAQYPPPGDNPLYGAMPPVGLVLPEGVELASVGRRVGAYFLSAVLVLVTLVIGYLIWGAIAWKKGTSPALQVLGMKVWKTDEGRTAAWGDMALRNIVGGFLLNSLCFIISIVSFFMFVSDDRRRTIADRIANTTVVHDPAKRLG